MITDGCVSKGNCISLSIQNRDRYILEKLEKDLGLENKIKPGNPLAKYQNRKQLSDDQIGEILIIGESVAAGYLGEVKGSNLHFENSVGGNATVSDYSAGGYISIIGTEFHTDSSKYNQSISSIKIIVGAFSSAS